MKRLINCLGRMTGKLISKEDADLIVNEAQAYQAEGLNPIDAERRAAQDALDFSQRSGESLLDQIQANAPQAHTPAVEFWNRQTIRKAGEAPPVAPVTPAAVPVPAAPPIAEAPTPAPPPIPEAAPPPVLVPAQQAVVDSIPENQRAKAARALEVDTSPDPQAPLPPAKKIAPEKNKILGEASKYGLLDDDATAQSVMERIAADKSQPRWIRTIMDLLVQVGAGRNVEIRVVNRPDSNWPALYVNQGRNKPGQILINLAVVNERGIAQSIAHEATHHVTMMKLRFDDYPLTDTERQAKEQLQKIFEDIQNRPEFKGEYGRQDLWEFASEVFSNDKLRAKLNAITPEGSRLSLMQIIRRLLAQVGFGDRAIRAGSLLEEAIRNTINVAGAPAAVREGIVAAPMAAEEHRMDIKREKREMAEKTRYTPAERTMLHGKISNLLDKKGLTGPERVRTEKEYQRQVEDQVRAARAKFSPEPPKGSPSDRWMEIEPKDVELQIEKGRKAQKAKKGRGGKPDTPAVEAIPDTEKAVVTWVEEAYTFEKDTDATEMARKVVDSVKEIVAKSKDPNAEGHANAVIQIRQRGWYRNMALRLRQEFGGFADIFADLLGALSPNTGVDQNWKFAIIALRNVSRGVYDAELKVFDEWLRAGKSINDYKKSGQPMILQPNGKLFGMNSDKAMKAMLDYWRLIKTGDSPKARNFALNLIGQSNKATIDVWAARFLQRMAGHPRVPILAERAVAGKHLTDATKVGGAFGFGQDVFKQATETLRKEMPEEFGKLNPPDLQALVWFAEKELWATKDWTSTIGEGGSFEAMADIEMVQRFVVGLSHERPHAVPTAQQQLAASKTLNAQLGEMDKVIASRVKDSYGMFMGKPERSFDVEVLAGPGFDPWEMVLHVAASAAANNQDYTFLSRVIPAKEINGNARPGLEIYFKEDVGPAALNSIMDFLKAKEVDGFTLVVDPRAEERVAKPVQMRGIRFQYIPEFSKDGDQWSEKAAEKEEILREAIGGILSQEGVASVNLVQYDTLVLTRNDYGNQINERELSRANVGGSRARVWIERARDAQYSRATEGGEGGAALGAPAVPGGVTEPSRGEAAARAPPEEGVVTAPMAPQPSYEDETTPLPDPHTGRAGMVRAMAQRLADSGWNRIESGPLSFGALSDLGRGAAAGGARVASVWRSLARSFRRREAALHGRIQEASRVLQRLNPDATGDQIGQKLFDYLVNRDQLIGDIELAGYIDQIRERIPVVPQSNFTSLPELEAGAEARVFRDAEAGLVYKLFKVQDGKTGSITPGEIRLGSDNQIRVFPGPRPSFPEFLGRIDRANSQGSIMPMEFVATTDAGDAVFAQPYFTGRGVSDRNAASALKQLDLGVLTQLGGTAALGKVNGKWVLFDDLHSRNVQVAPGGLVEVIDAINRELTPDEVDDLRELGKLPDVPDRPPITAPMAQARDESYRAVDQQWSEDFAAWKNHALKKEHVFNLGPASDELRLAGFPEGNITLTQGVLGEKPSAERHPFSVEALSDLPQKLRDPIAVFKSKTIPGALVVLTEIEDAGGRNFVVAVHIKPNKEGKPEIASVRSIYPKNNASILKWIDDGEATYYHKERALRWLHRIAGSNSLRAWNQLQATDNVKTNDDVVKGAEGEGPITAPMTLEETPVQDDTDVISSPLHPQGYQTRFWFGGGVPGSGYQAGGLFTARGRFNKEIWNALRTKTQNGRAVEMEADLVATQFRRLMKKIFGKKGPTPAQLRDINMALGTTDNRLTDAQAKQAAQFRDEKLKAQFIAAAHLQNVQAFKADQQAALARLPDELRDLIVHMRDLIDTASKNLVKDAGLSTDLKAAITENMGVYLHRSYKIFEHNDEWINFLESQRPEAQKIIARARVLFETYARAQKAKDHALEMKKAGTPVTLAQARAYAASQDVTQDVDALLEDYKRKGEEDSNVNLMAGRLPGKRGEAIMKERGQIPEEIRELWGEWDDPGINFMKSYVAAVTYLENTKFQNAVLTHGLNSGYMWKKGVSKGPRPAKWVEIAGSAKSMGALADVYGPKELADAFQLYNSPRVQGMIEKFLSATIAWPLAAKTVGSIGSTVRNFFGNPAFAIANGNVFNGSLWNAAKTSAAKFAKMGSDERIAYLRELVSLGIVGEDVTQGLLNDLINAVQKENLGIDPNENVLTKSWNATAKAMGKTAKGAAGLYSGVDNFWKIYGYEAELGKLKRAYRNDPAAPSEAEMKKQAADIVRKTMPTYSEASAIMRETKAIGKFIAPFIMFKTEVMRVTYGTLHQATIEIANPNWRIKRIGIQRLVGSAVMAALPWMLASATKFMFGYDDDDEDTIRDALPQWQKNATLFFLPKDKDGNPRYLDLSYMNPFNVIHAPITATMRALRTGDSDGPAMSAAAAGFFEFVRPFISEQLGVAAMIDVMRNQDSRVSFRPLWSAQDSGTQKLKAVAERLWHTFSPGTIDSIERIYQAKHGIVPKSGMPLSLGNEIMSPILGTKISTYDRMRGLSGQTARFEADKRDADQLFTDPFNSRGTVSEGAVADGYRKANEARKALYYTMRRNYLGAMSLGLTEKQARNWMVIGTGSEFNKKGLTQNDIDDVMHGRYRRYEASKESINEQRRLHPERFEEYKAARDAAPAVESIVD